MSSMSAQAMEEASNLATEFMYSMDNIPSEIRHICEEIKHLDSKAYDIQADIEGECQRYIEISLLPTGIPAHYKGPTQDHIQNALNEITQLTNAKVMLTHQMIALILRTQARLEGEVTKVRRLQGDPNTPLPPTRSASFLTPNYALNSNAATQMSQSLRSAMSPPVLASTPVGEAQARRSPSVRVASPAPTPTPTPSAPANKKRRLAAVSPSIKLPPARSISPVPPPKTATPVPRASRLSRQVHPPTPPPPVTPVPAAKPKPESPDPMLEDEEDADDDKPYCFCQKKSFGDMIACDGSNCPYEWFHLDCVGLKPSQVKESGESAWYCDLCKTKAGQTSARRRRR